MSIYKEKSLDELSDEELNDYQYLVNTTIAAFFKVVVTGCLLIKQPLFLDLGERHQLVCSS